MRVQFILIEMKRCHQNQKRYWMEDQISTEQPLPQSREGHQDITRGPKVKDLPKGKGQW